MQCRGRSGQRSGRVADKIGVSAETLRNWVRRAERDAGRRPGRREPVVVVGSALRP